MNTPNLDKAKKQIAEELVTKLKRESSVDGFKATDKFRRSIGYKSIADKIGIYAEQYAGALNDGSSPATSSANSSGKLNRIREWVRAKGIRPIKRNEAGMATFTKYKGTNAYERMVFAIARSISNKGTQKRYNYKGSGFIDRVVDEQKQTIKDTLLRAFQQDIANDLKNRLK